MRDEGADSLGILATTASDTNLSGPEWKTAESDAAELPRRLSRRVTLKRSSRDAKPPKHTSPWFYQRRFNNANENKSSAGVQGGASVLFFPLGMDVFKDHSEKSEI